MPNNAVHSRGTKLEIKTGSGAFVKVNGFKDFGGSGGGSPSVIDISDLDSVKKEKLIGLADEGTLTYSLNYLPADPGQIALKAARTSGAIVSLRITAATKTFTHDGYVMTHEISGGVDQAMGVSGSFEITGEIIEGTAA